MIILRTHAQWSYMTWLLMTLGVPDMIIVKSAARWPHRRWFRKFTVSIWPIRKEIMSSIWSILTSLSDMLLVQCIIITVITQVVLCSFLSFTTSTQTYLVSVLKLSYSFFCSCCSRTCYIFLFFNKVFDWLFLFFMLKVMMTYMKHSLKCWAKNMSLTPIWTWTWTRFAMETFVTCLKVIWYF